MVQPFSPPYPDHVHILDDVVKIGQVSHDLKGEKINLFLHQSERNLRVDSSISFFKERVARKNRRSEIPWSSIQRVFSSEDLQTLPAHDIAAKFLLSVHESTLIRKNEKGEKLLPLILDVAEYIKVFAIVLSIAESGSATSNVLATLSVQTKPRDYFEPIYYTSALDRRRLIHCNVNYAGMGMLWTPNNNVTRVPAPLGAPMAARVKDPDKFYDLKPGQAAFFTGNHDSGLVVVNAFPLRPDDPPSINLNLRQHFHPVHEPC